MLYFSRATFREQLWSQVVLAVRSVGLLSVKFCFTAGDHVIIIQPSPGDTSFVTPSGDVFTSSGKSPVSSADCCSALLGSSGRFQRSVSLCSFLTLQTVCLLNHTNTCNRINTFLRVLQDKPNCFPPCVPSDLSVTLLAHTYQRCYVVKAEHSGEKMA